jgi:hypothetical protein
MYETNIEFKGQIIPVRFGTYVLKCIADDGIKLTDMQERMTENPADIIPKIIYYGALNASPERKGENVSLNLIYDWLDEVEGGLFSEKVTEMIQLFTKQMTEGVPKNVKAGSKTPQNLKKRT